MLEPAIIHKAALDRNFAKFLYTENYFLYMGYRGGNELPEIRAQDDYFQYAVVDSKGNVTGYLAYHLESATDTVDRFGLFSFKKGNVLLARDLFEKLEELVSIHRRVEWRMIGGNPVEKRYDQFCREHGGHKCTLHRVMQDLQGNWRDEHIYEIVKD